MFDSVFTWLLLPLGMALGWVMARGAPGTQRSKLSPEQLGGLLTHLVSDDSDEAIRALTEAAEVDNSTAELHLTLGSLFRKRGEVDRALRIHEALLARPGLRADLQHQARFELAHDFLKAGLIDRAEQLYQQLVDDGLFVGPSLEQIQKIYEQGRDWQHAIDTARRIEASKGEPRRAVIAQYFCEMADEARREGAMDEALKLARKAQDADKSCVRADLLLGALAEAAGDPAGAIKSYRRAIEQHPRYLPEAIEPLRRCFEQTGDRAGYLQVLKDARELSASSLPLLAEAQLLRAEGVDVMEHLSQSLQARPSRAVLAEFLEALESKPDIIAAGLDKPAASLRAALKRVMETAPRYQCSQCGFAPRQLFWQCPSCKSWGTTSPIDDPLEA